MGDTIGTGGAFGTADGAIGCAGGGPYAPIGDADGTGLAPGGAKGASGVGGAIGF